jgi:predicted  nucleic acid-binding Zn-ribbon protein
MVEIANKKLKEAEDELRELMNLVAVFNTEYDLPDEVVDKLQKKLQKVSRIIGSGIK